MDPEDDDADEEEKKEEGEEKGVNKKGKLSSHRYIHTEKEKLSPFPFLSVSHCHFEWLGSSLTLFSL